MAFLSVLDGALGKLDEWYFRYDCHVNRASPLLFHGGWGSHAALAELNAQWFAPTAPVVASVAWEGEWRPLRAGVWQRCGSFASPCYVEHLPPESARAWLHFVRPGSMNVRNSTPFAPMNGPVVVLMPTSSEAGVQRRLPIACALAKQGISSVLLESPFMGRRRPAAQYKTTLSYFSDYALLCGACIEEARAVLAWLGREGCGNVCVAGISKGGYLATVAGLRPPLQAHVVALLPPHSGSAVLLDGLLSGLCDFDSLQRTSGVEMPVREHMREVFELTSLEHLPLPHASQSLLLIGARQDRYVPRYSYEKLAQRWQGYATMEWLAGGHVSSIAESGHLVGAICRTLLAT
jgi:hypothetical protein